MALPATDISTALVKDVLGETSNNIGVLRKSTKNNWWGFFSQNRGWGVNYAAETGLDYRLGDYRLYDHYRRCFAFWGLSKTEEIGQGVEVFIELIFFPEWSEETTETEHTFTILFSRTGNFGHNEYVEWKTITIQNIIQGYIFVGMGYGPDGSTLTYGDTFYIAVIHKNSTSLRWDEKRNTTPEGYISGRPYWSIKCTMPKSAWTNILNIYTVGLNLWRQSAANNGFAGNVVIRHDLTSNYNISVQVEMSKYSTFITDVVSHTVSATITKNETSPGTPILQDIPVGGNLSTLFAVGDTVYYRCRITIVDGSIPVWSNAWSGTYYSFVQSTLPLD